MKTSSCDAHLFVRIQVEEAGQSDFEKNKMLVKEFKCQVIERSFQPLPRDHEHSGDV